ncbi:putative proton-dependent oligopeptide transporter family [Helianthus anomalus]
MIGLDWIVGDDFSLVDFSCNPPSLTHLVFLYTCFILLSIGLGCIRSCSIALGAYQLKHHPTTWLEGQIRNCCVDYALFCSYVCTRVVSLRQSESLFTGLVQVLVVAFKNRRIRLLPDGCYNHSEETDQVELTDNLRFLNNACVLRDFNPNSSKLDRWSLSTVEKVESLKLLIRVLPLWSTCILIFTTLPQTFPTLPAKTMNCHVIS